MIYLTEITMPQNIEQLTALKESIESGNVPVTDIEVINMGINLLSHLPYWAYMGIGLVGIICIIDALKHSVKAAIIMCLIFGPISLSGIASNVAVDTYTNQALEIINQYYSSEALKQTAEEAVENGKVIIDKSEEAIQSGKEIISDGKEAIEQLRGK